MDRAYSAIQWEREGHVGIITLNRPEQLNAIGPELREELPDIMDRVAADAELRVLIITGTGKAFSAGGDLGGFLQRSRSYQAQGGAIDLFSNSMSRKFLGVEIPIIAAINGAAVGGGFTLSLTCDIRIASEAARFGAVFARVGLSPEYGSSFLLSRVVGLTKASELVLTARIFDAQEALSMGLVGEVVPEEQLMARAKEIAGQIAGLSPVAVRMGKRTLRHGLDSTLSQALDYEELAESHCFSSLDHQESVKAFMEKRAPEFKGR
ncbi:MAG: enoyl-CoA hydratase/isomerase family protein [Deltaproteobacteria bacterium]|nr:enoyl-CoA hydratase/isomerase family protein [Deltaproteobacteria bacterium]